MAFSLRRTTLLLQLALSVAATGVTGLAMAQSYPSKAVTIVVPFPAGGGPDLLGRVLAEKLASRLGQAVIVDNKPGAGGLLGAGLVAKSAADGHMLLLSPNTLVISPHVLPKGAGAGVDVTKDLQPIIAPVSTPMVLVASPQLGVNNMKDLVAMVRKSPGLPYASAGNGSPMHFAGEMFKKSAGVDMLHVPYKGTAPAVTAVLGGEVKLLFIGLGGVTQHLKAGKLVALGATEKTRTSMLPTLPTAKEQGFANVEVNAWYGLFAPTGTPPAVMSRLNQEVNAVLAMPDVRERLLAAGLEVLGGTPQTLAGFVKEDSERYAVIAREFNIKAD